MVLSLQTFLNNFTNSLEASIRNHLKNVFACLAMSAVAAIIGGLIKLFTKIMQFRFLSYIGASFFLGLLLVTFDDNNTRVKMRMVPPRICDADGGKHRVLLGKGNYDWSERCRDSFNWNSACLYVKHNLFTFGSKRQITVFGKHLYYTMDHFYESFIGNIVWIVNVVPSTTLYVFFFCTWGLVLHDTPWMIKRRRRGINDFVTHSLAFLLDCFVIFLRVFIILIQESQKKRRNWVKPFRKGSYIFLPPRAIENSKFFYFC